MIFSFLQVLRWELNRRLPLQGRVFLLQIAKDLSGRFSQQWEAELGLAPSGPLPGALWPAGPAPLAD